MVPVWKPAFAFPKVAVEAIVKANTQHQSCSEARAQPCQTQPDDVGCTSTLAATRSSAFLRLTPLATSQLSCHFGSSLTALLPYLSQTEMPEPLSVAASVVGITVPALHGVRLLLGDLQQLKDAPKTVKRLTEDLHSVGTALKLLQDIEDREWNSLGAIVAKESKRTITSCTEACEQFRPELQRWTRHSDDGNLAWRDRTSVGFFKKSQIKTQTGLIQLYRYSSVRHSHITEDIKQMISAKQADVQSAITSTNKQLAVLEDRVKELNLSSDEDEETAGSQEDRPGALRQLEEERKAVDASRRLLEELLSKAQEKAVAKAAGNGGGSYTVTFGDQNSGFQAGVFNGGVSGLSFGGK